MQDALRERLVDDLHLVVVPTLLGGGERLFDRLDGGPVGYAVVDFAASPAVVHVHLRRA